MKYLLIVSLLVSTLFANHLQKVDTSFSKKVQKTLLNFLSSLENSKIHTKQTYILKKGWNQLTTPKNGIDVIKTFQDISEVKFVVTYDFKSKYWAGFTLQQDLLKDIREMLLLKYLEPNITFFILSDKDMMISVKSTKIDATCKSIMQQKDYSYILDSGLTKTKQQDISQNISINSRYSSHEYRGIYNDTRIILIYPKITKVSKKVLKYGPAEPMVMINYADNYADKYFYIYDYLEKRCYKGIFPSKKVPPLPTLQKI